MSKVTVLNRDIDSSLVNRLDPVVYLPKVAAPFTSVVKRARVTDFANDLLPKFGVERVMMQSIQEAQGEFGPNGERVWKPINDVHDAVRMVGSWSNINSSFGAYCQTSDAISYFEITFYGTGLNIISYSGAAYDWRASTDGGAEGGNLFGPGASGSGVLGNRNYSANQIFNVVSGLSLGLHTVKIRGNNAIGMAIFGYEILNTSSTLQLSPGSSYVGGRRLYSPSLTTAAYNSGFESGTLGTKGGHVLVYQKADGTIAKAVTPTNAAAAYLVSADHTNEEVIRTYHWREFGAGRADDFSSVAASTDSRAFTLDDGTTTLVGSSVTNNNETLVTNANGAFFTFTFVGTGIDFVRVDSGILLDQHTFYIDGVSVGTISGSNGSTATRIQKVASGLPYGTHTFRMTRDAYTNNNIRLTQFIVYGPSKPSLPAGAVELADYYVMGDFAANTTVGYDNIATGVLRKASAREMVYANGTGGTTDWTGGNAPITTYIGGFGAFSDRQNAYFEYTFFGTGFEQRFSSHSNRSANVQVSLQSLSTGGSLQNLTTTNFPTISTSAYGTGINFNASTGILDQQDAASQSGCGMRVSGLPLGAYRVRFLNNTASSYIIHDALDIITPIHAPGQNQPGDLQNTLSVGSESIRDLRKFGSVAVKPLTNWAQAVGVASSPNTSSTSFVPMPDMSLTLKTNGNPVQIFFQSSVYSGTTGATMAFLIYVNGVNVPGVYANFTSTGNTIIVSPSLSCIVPLPAGAHKIDVYWVTSSGAQVFGFQNLRILTAREL